MKKILSFALALFILCSASLVSCKKQTTDLFQSAVYKEDTTIGEGKKTLHLIFKIPDHTVNFTVLTDKNTVGDALLEVGLIEGDNGPYGLYVKKTNGILADYDIDRSYWAFYINGDMAMSGVDMTEIDESAEYTLEYSI